MLKDFLNKIIKKTVNAARSSSGSFLLKRTDFGLVRAEFSVVQKLAERVLNSIAGIDEATVVVEKYSEANPLKIRLTLTLTEINSAPKVSETADKKINDELQNILGVDFYVPVEVYVRQITKTAPPKRRVR